jgi:hypothetical protein
LPTLKRLLIKLRMNVIVSDLMQQKLKDGIKNAWGSKTKVI